VDFQIRVGTDPIQKPRLTSETHPFRFFS
jgi:hypothetical protein